MISLPSMMTWTLKKKGPRSEPAEMGVPFSDHSVISRSNKNTHPCSFICGNFFFVCFFICICSNARFSYRAGDYISFSICCNNSPLLVLLKVKQHFT